MLTERRPGATGTPRRAKFTGALDGTHWSYDRRCTNGAFSEPNSPAQPAVLPGCKSEVSLRIAH